jgi:hypothetical protein
VNKSKGWPSNDPIRFAEHISVACEAPFLKLVALFRNAQAAKTPIRNQKVVKPTIKGLSK